MYYFAVKQKLSASNIIIYRFMFFTISGTFHPLKIKNTLPSAVNKGHQDQVGSILRNDIKKTVFCFSYFEIDTI